MSGQGTRWTQSNAGGMRYAMAALGVALLTSGCVKMMDAGCNSYAEARLSMPADPLGTGPWPQWIADTDDRMTGACK